LNGEAPARSDLIRLAAIIETLLGAAERVDGELVSDTLIAELYELRERVHAALQP
jgi:predicted regulator of Ras-like GTPase activity (Roadblock/LC7/MglB family)